MEPVEKPNAIAYQVTLKEAAGVSPFKPIENKEPISETRIQQKLELADERRMSLKSQIKEQATNELKRAQEKVQKVQEDNENKKKKIEEDLAADLEAKEQNRRLILEEKKGKFQKRLAAHSKNVEEMNDVLKNARKQLSERISSELELAEDRRNQHLGGLLDRIKEHDTKIVEARKNIDEAQTAYAEKIAEKMMEKLENGMKNRQEQIDQLVDRLHDHTIHVENVRKNKKTAADGEES